MQYRTVPKNGDKLSILGFGTMRLPLNGQDIDAGKAVEQIRFAIDHGVNYVDSAPPYHNGESEKVLGKALSGGYREKVKIATKLTSFLLNKAEDMPVMLDTQLKKLQTDHIDYYLLHGLEEESWKKLRGFQVFDFIEKAKADGKIVNLGFSFHGSLDCFKEIVDSYDWAMCQILYNFLDDELQAGTKGLKYASKRRLAVMVMEPLRGGALASNLPKEVMQVYEKARVRRSPAEWALRWVWNHPEVTLALSGMNEMSQVTENLKVASDATACSLKSSELRTMRLVADTFRQQLMKVPCTGCQYCMPCPFGVNIPSNFRIYNDFHMFGDEPKSRAIYARMLMGVLTGKRADAALCRQCKKCMERCPQHIEIPERLKEVAKDLGGPKTEAMAAAMRSQTRS